MFKLKNLRQEMNVLEYSYKWFICLIFGHNLAILHCNRTPLNTRFYCKRCGKKWSMKNEQIPSY